MQSNGSKRSKTAVRTKKAPTLVGLTGEEVKHLPRARAGFEPFARTFIGLFRDHGAELGSADVAALEEALDASDELAPKEAAARTELDLIQKTRFMHRAVSWRMTLLFYGRLKQLARTNVDIKRAIAPFEQLMKQKAHKKPVVIPPPEPPKPTMN